MYRARTTDGTCKTAFDKTAISTTPNWTDNIYRFQDLPRYDENRIAYCYTVEETPTFNSEHPKENGDYYVSETDGSGLNFTNTLVGPQTSFTGTKRWMEGENGSEHENETEIVLELYRESETTKKTKITGKEIVWEGNSFTYSGLEKYDSKGYPYVYTAHETKINGKTPSAAGYQVYYDNSSAPWDGKSNNSGTVITNVRYETVSVTSTKTWTGDLTGKTHNNKNEIKLTLSRVSSKSGATEETVSNAAPSWNGNNYTFSSLPKYDNEGYEYTYIVKENVVNGYTTAYDAEDPLKITNTKNYSVKHQFDIDEQTKQDHPDKTLPQTILNRQPADQTDKPYGAAVTPSAFNTDPVTISDGIWEWVKWDEPQKTVGTADVVFTGT